MYLQLIVTELAKEDSNSAVRQAAGLAAKNALTAKVCLIVVFPFTKVSDFFPSP